MNTLPFNTIESFFCQWTGGAKEYFTTLQEAINKANEMYIKKEGMSNENHIYWLSQKSIIGKEITIRQQLDIISADGR